MKTSTKLALSAGSIVVAQLVIAIAMVSLVACGDSTSESAPTTDTASVAVDSNIVKIDSIKTVTDTTKIAAVDTTKKK